ncbi:DNA/RNA non-specific endonuclease [Kibdelosporangium aridum]|uniref:DNA/RNA non-specific endonuclease n=1 Tax=Kibdelosporangium aridum TaxID=2030 RepID=UPI0035EBF6A4
MKKLPRRPVVLAVVVALFAGIVNGSATAAPERVEQSQVQNEPDPDQEQLLAQLERDLIADIAGSDREDEEVRTAARETLRKLEAGDRAAAQIFFDVGYPAAKAKAKKRKEDADAANRAQIQPLAGTGGPAFRAAVDRALRGDARAREEFLAFGRDIAAEEDRRNGAHERELKDRRRAHVQTAAQLGGPEVSKAAKAALAQGDAAIEEFLRTGYLAAAQRDAEERERQLAELERQRKEAEAASELAQRTARAMRARTALLAAHADGLKFLERTANDMTLAANASREAARVLAADLAGGTYHAELYQRAKDDVARQLGYAVTDAAAAQSAANVARTQANILVENQMPHGAQWAKVVQGMGASAEAAKLATQTAVHAVDAITAEAAATDATEKAKAHMENAKRWNATAKSHADSAKELATAAKEQALAAADAAARAKQARLDAEAALARAQAHAENVKRARTTAEDERDIAARKRDEAQRWRDEAGRKRLEAEAKQREAAAQRAIAQREAGVAAAKRQEAEALQRTAAQKRRDAQAQEQIAADAAAGARAQEKIALDAMKHTQDLASQANQLRQQAEEASRSADTAEKKAKALEDLAQRAAGMADATPQAKEAARVAAQQARTDATTARQAANDARTAANDAGAAAEQSRAASIAADAAAGRSRAAADRAQSAASAARAAANEAEAAAEKSRAAANEAQAAAARANQAANQAETEAAAVHAEAVKANASAEEATAQEARAADNARKAVELANQAAWESVQALDAARRTQDEANASAIEAATAATQAGIATRAAAAATRSSSAIATPASTAIDLTSPFAQSDVDADFVAMVAARARDLGDSHQRAANQAAANAVEQARQAAAAAETAQGEIAPAFHSASEAAKAAEEAAKSAAAAQVSAAAAAVDGAAARAAAAQANAVDAQAQADALAARAAANQAAADAALAGRAADQAEADARAARQAANNATRAADEARAAATRATRDAEAARAAAAQAQIDADEARKSADRANEHALAAEESAKNAENYAREAEKSAANAEASAKNVEAMLAQMLEQLRREAEERNRREIEEVITDESEIPGLTPEEEQALREARGQQGIDEFNTARANANKTLLSYIEAEGGQILLDLIGYTDAKRCFTEGDFIACVMTVLNAIPIARLAKVLSKIPEAVSTAVKIVKGLRTFKDAVTLGRRVAKQIKDYVQRYIKKCKTGIGSKALGPRCDVDQEQLWDPTKSPKPGETRSNPIPFPLALHDPLFPKLEDEDKRRDKSCSAGTDRWEFNTKMHDFGPALRATGGAACVLKTSGIPGNPATPASLDPSKHDKGHIIGAAFYGSNEVKNIVPQFKTVNQRWINHYLEGKVRRALKAGDRVYMAVLPYYGQDPAVPERMYFYAYGMKTDFRCIGMMENTETATKPADCLI